MKLISVCTMIDKFKVNGYFFYLRSLARQAIKHLADKAIIKPCGTQSAKFKLYTTAVEKVVKEVTAVETKAAKATKGKK